MASLIFGVWLTDQQSTAHLGSITINDKRGTGKTRLWMSFGAGIANQQSV